MATPSPEQIAYWEAHASDNLRPNIIACVSTCTSLAVVSVAARVYARWLGGNSLFLADILIVVALCLYIPFSVALALCTNSGLGKHIIFVTNARLLQIYFISSEVIYSVVIVTVKWSILAFYWRIFPQVWFRRTLVGVAIFMGAWMFTTVFSIIFQCTPIEYNWNTTIKDGHCINIAQLALTTSILNVLTDVTILVLPLPLVWQLNVSRRRRWSLVFLFALGGGACVVGIIRAVWIGKLNAGDDATWDNVPAAYLSAIEILAGFVVACIPSYPAIFFHVTGKTQASKRSYGLTPGRSGGSGQPGALSSNKFLGRRPVVSWNRITNTDDIDMVSQPRLTKTLQTTHEWETVTERNEEYIRERDQDQESTTALRKASREMV